MIREPAKILAGAVGEAGNGWAVHVAASVSFEAARIS